MPFVSMTASSPLMQTPFCIPFVELDFINNDKQLQKAISVDPEAINQMHVSSVIQNMDLRRGDICHTSISPEWSPLWGAFPYPHCWLTSRSKAYRESCGTDSAHTPHKPCYVAPSVACALKEPITPSFSSPLP